MKRLLEIIPFLLLVSLVPFFYYNTPTISQAIIILAVSALCGYRYYAMDQERPDYVALFEDSFNEYKKSRDTELQEIVTKHEKAMVHLEKNVKELSASYGKITMEQATNGKKSNFIF